MNDNELGAWLVSQADDRNLSLRKVARLAHLSQTTVSKIANGERTNVRAETCQALAIAFNRPVEEVMRIAGLFTVPSSRLVRDSRRVVYEVNTDEVLLRQYHALRPEDQDRVRDLIARLGQLEPRIIGDEAGE